MKMKETGLNSIKGLQPLKESNSVGTAIAVRFAPQAIRPRYQKHILQIKKLKLVQNAIVGIFGLKGFTTTTTYNLMVLMREPMKPFATVAISGGNVCYVTNSAVLLLT